MRPEDVVRVRHMIDAAEEAVGFAHGKTRESLDLDRMLTLALIKDIEIIGEAASKIGEETKALHPHVPWPAIVAMRNRLIHAYFNINLDILWQTIEEDLPFLLSRLRKIIPLEH